VKVQTYVTDQNFGGRDSFTYIASDGIATSQPSTITVLMPQDPSPPQAPVTILADLRGIGLPPPPPPPIPQVALIPNPTQWKDYYYNYMANRYNTGMGSYPFQGAIPWQGPPGTAPFKWNVLTAPVPTPSPYYGPLAAIGISVPNWYYGVYLVPFDSRPLGPAGIVAYEYWYGWCVGRYGFSIF
jgi:hypothetical protein